MGWRESLRQHSISRDSLPVASSIFTTNFAIAQCELLLLSLSHFDFVSVVLSLAQKMWKPVQIFIEMYERKMWTTDDDQFDEIIHINIMSYDYYCS